MKTKSISVDTETLRKIDEYRTRKRTSDKIYYIPLSLHPIWGLAAGEK